VAGVYVRKRKRWRILVLPELDRVRSH
jgi:hypothetical protein